MPREINHLRRRLLGTAAMTIAAAPLAMVGFARAQSGNAEPARLPTIKPATNTSFGPLKQLDAGVLNVGYAEGGPADGPVVMLLHGWPYDIHSFVDVVPLLAARGYRVIVPHLRGYGSTRFLTSATPRNGQQAALGVDVIALMDALKINEAIIGGFAGTGSLPRARGIGFNGRARRINAYEVSLRTPTQFSPSRQERIRFAGLGSCPGLRGTSGAHSHSSMIAMEI